MSYELRKHLSVFVKELNSEYQSRPHYVNHRKNVHHFTPHEIDKGMFCLFANNKSNPKELFERSSKIENSNKNNSNEKSFENDYQVKRNYELLFKKPLKSTIGQSLG
ncbi:hypothetical protein Glove_71g123 [Diversispora epigaea]|uniref:Uncharacterized protein n=1 Tax=Diversispora epigaea TaxID=1348612 RepID=A0A397JGK2_9GLOM|nr:hypothetical protein Glove_71g123 [Diversispora epigaea]